MGFAVPDGRRPELLQDPRFLTFIERRENADDIDAILIDWMKDKTRQEIFQIAAGTWSEPAAPLLELDEVLADPQLSHRRFFAKIAHPDAGTLTYPTAPFKMSLTPPTFRRAPKLGEHTDEALAPSPQLSQHGGEGWDGGENAALPNTTPSPSTGEGWDGGESPGILSDVRILDLTRVWSGPLATRILTDFGAEVIKISDPRAPIDRANGTNNKLNRNKSNLALRLDHEEGRRMFLELAAASDVIVENFRPRVMRNFGLDYERLREVRPDVIMCSMPGFGTTGEYADYPAFGPSRRGYDRIAEHDGLRRRPPANVVARLPRSDSRTKRRSRRDDRAAPPPTDGTRAVHRRRAQRRSNLPDRRAHSRALADWRAARPAPATPIPIMPPTASIPPPAMTSG